MRASRGAVAGPLAWSRGRLDAPPVGIPARKANDSLCLSFCFSISHCPRSSLSFSSSRLRWFFGSRDRLRDWRFLVNRLSGLRLVELAGGAPERERRIIETVVSLRLASVTQLERLYFARTATPASRARLARRTLARLVELRLLGRLERRIGGVRPVPPEMSTAGRRAHSGLSPTGRARALAGHAAGMSPASPSCATRSGSARATCELRRPTARAGSSYWSSKASPRPGEPSSVRRRTAVLEA